MKILRTALVLALTMIGVQSAYAQATLLPPAEMCLSASTGINGSIGLLGSITGGSGYVAGSYGGVALTGGSGTGATANITVAGGIVTGVAVLNPGVNYVVGDVLSASNANLGGAGSGFSFPVASIGINSNLAAGKIGFYVPGTLTFKTTWRNATQTTPNTNPVTLDANGCAVIYGIGSYRMIVKDSLGNTVWDQVTTAPASSAVTTATSGAGDFLPLGAIIPISGFTAPTNYVLAYGQAISRTTYSDALAAITISSNASCTSGSTTVSGITSTAQMRAGAPIESSCLAPGTTIATIASSVSVTVSVAATTTASATIKVFNWGNGDGSTTFNVPDLRGRVLAGPDSMGGSAASRLTSTYYGISAAPPSAASSAPAGQLQTLGIPNLPPYTPAGLNSTPSITISGGTIGGTLNIGNPAGGGSSPFTGAAISAALNGAPIFAGTPQGGTSTAFSIVQPTLTINYAIKVLNGTLPITGVLSLGGMTGDILCGSGVTCTGGIITSDGSGGTLLTNNIFVGNASNIATGVPLSGDCTIAATGAITCTNTGGVAFSTSATVNTANAANITSGILPDARLSTTIAAAGPIGDATHIPVITYDSHGRLTTVSTIATGALQATSNLSDLTNAATARTSLGLGSIATQAASAIAITGGSVTGLPSPTAISDAATKGYVDGLAVGLSLKQAAKYGSVAALAANTYANGASGVGATLTGNANGAVSFDGSTPSAADRVLVKNEAAAANNGCYTVTTVGSGGAPYVLTRCTDLDTAAELLAGSALLITNGSTLANTGWALQSTVTTVGTTAANFAQYAGGSQWTNLAADIYFLNKVGIGSSTAPSFDLDIERNTNGFLGMRVYNANAGSSAASDVILGTDTSATIGQLLALSSTNTTYAGANSVNLINGTNNPLGFGTNNTIRAVINGSGLVGIGTTAPIGKLHVLATSGYTSIYENDSGINFAQLLSNNGGSNVGSTLQFTDGVTNSAAISSIASGGLRLATAGTDRLLIDQSGHVQFTANGAGTIAADASGNLRSSRTYYGAAYGMVCDGATANDTAWGLLTAAYAAAPGPIILPPGKCNFSSSIGLTVSGTDGTGASIVGAGANSSVLVFTGATNGLVINYTASIGWNYGSLTLQDFGVQTKRTDAGSGLIINGGSTTGVPSAPVYIKNVHVYADVSPHRWVVGLALNNVHRVMMDAFTYDGDNDSFDHGIGISINGTGQEIVEIMMSNVDINYAANGIAVTGHVQGVFCTSCNLTATTIGVAWNTDIIEPQFQFSGQIAATNYCMYLNNLSAASINGLLCVPTGSPNQVAIYASNVVESQFSNITIESSAANVNGFVFANGSLNNIVSNARINGSGTGCGVWFQSGANNNTYNNINVIGGLSCTLLDQGSGNAGYSPSASGAFATSLFSNALASNVGYITRTGTGGGFGSNAWNIWWTGAAAHLYIDNTDIGSFNITSDVRFKNVLPEKPANVLDKIASLDFFRYRYRDLGIMKDDGIERDGFSASQLQRLFPSAVNGTPDGLDASGIPIPQTINQPELLPVMLKAIQELKGANDELRADVLFLKRRDARRH